MEALWLWKQFPRQIASDLSRYHHRRIAEWHDGSMSSYELLELIDQLPARGSFRTAVRGGELCVEDQMLRHGINEVTRLRAIMNSVHGGKSYVPTIYYSQAEILEMQEEQAAVADGRESVYQFADRTYQKELEEMEEVNND